MESGFELSIIPGRHAELPAFMLEVDALCLAGYTAGHVILLAVAEHRQAERIGPIITGGLDLLACLCAPDSDATGAGGLRMCCGLQCEKDNSQSD